MTGHQPEDIESQHTPQNIEHDQHGTPPAPQKRLRHRLGGEEQRAKAGSARPSSALHPLRGRVAANLGARRPFSEEEFRRLQQVRVHVTPFKLCSERSGSLKELARTEGVTFGLQQRLQATIFDEAAMLAFRSSW